ncbi:hypothetical protein [Streptomyces chartreusis]|uniref:DUF2637 domain-containing protein n=1 Tax=Streptomyces chartreusis TaxID=1969 RepID=A0A7H8T9V3_STRCX|nr:hypothetical protein [Streptomyces chartreusis]QKZ20289.1 hypothetical protein HUT05_24810 [Streptomyces chartreusis]
MTTTFTDPPSTSWAEQDARAEAIRVQAQAQARAEEAAAEVAAAKAAPQIAAAKAKAEEIDRNARTAREEDEEKREARREARVARQKAEKAEAEQMRRAAQSAHAWRQAAMFIAIACVVVSLPMQISFFWDSDAPWLGAVPFVLEGIAFALLKGAAAAIDDHRPSWHYRLGALGVAINSAVISYIHGVEVYGLATALGAAFCSVAGPAVWDLHEHGRISKRDGKVPWRARRAKRAAERRQAKARAAEAKAKRAAQKAAEEKVAAYEQAVLDGYAARHPEVFGHALDVAAAFSETSVTRQVWARAWRDVHGTDVGDTSEWMTMRALAEGRVAEARGHVQLHPTMPMLGAAHHFIDLGERHASALAKSGDAFDQEAPASLPKGAREGTELAGQASRKAGRSERRSRRAGRKQEREGGARRKPLVRAGQRGRTRREQLTDEQLDDRVRALDPDEPTLSARYVARAVGCDQARAKQSLIRVDRYAH